MASQMFSSNFFSLDDKIHRDCRKNRTLLYEIRHRTFEVLTAVLLKFKSTGMFRLLA
jgi:hypothetical protein